MLKKVFARLVFVVVLLWQGLDILGRLDFIISTPSKIGQVQKFVLEQGMMTDVAAWMILVAVVAFLWGGRARSFAKRHISPAHEQPAAMMQVSGDADSSADKPSDPAPGAASELVVHGGIGRQISNTGGVGVDIVHSGPGVADRVVVTGGIGEVINNPAGTGKRVTSTGGTAMETVVHVAGENTVGVAMKASMIVGLACKRCGARYNARSVLRGYVGTGPAPTFYSPCPSCGEDTAKNIAR